MIREDKPQRLDRPIAPNHQHTLLLEVGLVEAVFVGNVCWALAEVVAYLPEGRKHVLDGFRIRGSEPRRQPFLEQLDYPFPPDNHLSVLTYLFVIRGNVLYEDVTIQVLRHHLVEQVYEVVEFLQRGTYKEAEGPGHLVVCKITTEHGWPPDQCAHLIDRAELPCECHENRDALGEVTEDGRSIIVGVELILSRSSEHFGVPDLLVLGGQTSEVPQEHRHRTIQVVVAKPNVWRRT